MKRFLRRFEKLENRQSFPVARNGFKVSKRFERLEINDRRIELSIQDAVSPEEQAPSGINYFTLCPYCGQENTFNEENCAYCKRPLKGKSEYISDYTGQEHLLKRCICGAVNLKERKNCWVCGKDFAETGKQELTPKKETNVIVVNIDGILYKSTDENLPDDIRQLMVNIRRKGYSEDLINAWISDRNSRIESERRHNEIRLTQVRWELGWRIAAAVIFGIFMIAQFIMCSSPVVMRR
jgi:hypothetical protein